MAKERVFKKIRVSIIIPLRINVTFDMKKAP